MHGAVSLPSAAGPVAITARTAVSPPHDPHALPTNPSPPSSARPKPAAVGVDATVGPRRRPLSSGKITAPTGSPPGTAVTVGAAASVVDTAAGAAVGAGGHVAAGSAGGHGAAVGAGAGTGHGGHDGGGAVGVAHGAAGGHRSEEGGHGVGSPGLLSSPNRGRGVGGGGKHLVNKAKKIVLPKSWKNKIPALRSHSVCGRQAVRVISYHFKSLVCHVVSCRVACVATSRCVLFCFTAYDVVASLVCL